MPRSAPHIVFPATATEPAVTLPAIGQGTWYMGEDRLPAAKEADALRHGLDQGLTLIDTAEMYGDGGAEKVVGRALVGRRDDAFVVSKVYPWNAGRDSAIAACEQSLARMQLDTIDLYLLHWPGSVPLEETFEAFERLRDQGKIRRFGVSNFDAEQLGELDTVSGAAECATDQVLYHLGSRGVEVDVLPWLEARSLPAMAYCPLAQAGRLANRVMNAAVVESIAAEHAASPAQILLAWVIRNRAATDTAARPTIAIPKASTLAHVEANAAALSISLTPENLARLDDAFPAPDLPVPLDIV